MLSYYLAQFLQRKLFEFKQQIEGRKKRGKKKDCWQINRIWEREVFYMQSKIRRGGEFIFKKKMSDMIKMTV